MIVRGRATSQSDESSRWKEKAFQRLVFLIAILIGLILVIFAQLFRLQVLQWTPGGSLLTPPLQNQPIAIDHRGWILDRHGYILALNIYEYDVSAAPNLIEDPQDVANRLSPLLDMPPDELTSLLDQEGFYVPLQRVSKEIAEAIEAQKLEGIYLEPKLRREYPERELAAHVTGFVTFEYTGTYGVEGYYDPLLKGIVPITEWYPELALSQSEGSAEEGMVYVQDKALPDVFDQLALPPDGPHLVLTLDRNIQYLVERELEKAIAKYKADSGTIIVMDPKTGVILAMASYPSYDPNLFYQAKELRSNPAISDHYEPGSVFKIITMAAGLDAGAITTQSTFYDPGMIEVGGCVILNPDRRAHGVVTMTDILAHSLNVDVAHVSTSLGAERFYAYVRDFGFGSTTGVDLYGEIPGLVKTPGSKEWTECDLATNSFGQGISVTPLQMITAVAAVANGGFLMKPYVVERVVYDHHVVVIPPTVVRRVISAQSAKQVTEMLVEAVKHGAPLAVVPGYDIAGKTGTAQVPVGGSYSPDFTIASFVGYAPADDPQFIVLVKIDKPRTALEGSAVAAPVFKAIAERLFSLLSIPPASVRLASR
jgi:cell division protein FtsI (penicillin-binding protein 3)